MTKKKTRKVAPKRRRAAKPLVLDDTQKGTPGLQQRIEDNRKQMETDLLHPDEILPEPKPVTTVWQDWCNFWKD